ncbi:MAG: RlmE family RNA methyltransferase [Spirochaetes bacterium]|nr:RlmE family RNA methyltransferase [Spirochaetota bacterium]MBU0955267.1 RlmE family RNA methyltransferase [Spirochaetota bacterium]
MAKNSYEKADFWTLKAKKEGYPARSVYKLEEIDRKFGIIKPGQRVLDIGAAPGSWSLWILKKQAGRGFLSAVDLSPLKIPVNEENMFFVQGDLYDPAVHSQLAQRGPYHTVVSDAAPATSGNRSLDTDRSEAIVEAVLDYAAQLLLPGGNFVCKLFIGGGQRELLDRMKGLFTTARAFKPEACRQESFETFLIGLGRKPE